MDYSKFQTTIDRSNMFYWQGDRPFNAKETKEIFLDRHATFNMAIAKAAIEYGMVQVGKSVAKAKVIHIEPPIVSGSVNIVCKAKLEDSSSVILRMHPSNIKNGYFWSESIASEKAKEIGVPSYETYFIDDTKSKFNFDYMLIECLQGKNIKKDLWPLSEELDKQIASQTGQYAAMINSISTEGYGFFDNTVAKKEKRLMGIHPEWTSHIYAAYEKNLDYLEQTGTITKQVRHEIEKIFVKKDGVMICEHPTLVQNDIADWNELALDGKVTGIIDWDECFSGDPIMEIAAWSLFFDEKRLHYFLNGYQSYTKLPDYYEEKFHIYRLRYVICKIAMRKKKLEYEYNDTPLMQDLLTHGLQALHEELVWQQSD